MLWKDKRLEWPLQVLSREGIRTPFYWSGGEERNYIRHETNVPWSSEWKSAKVVLTRLTDKFLQDQQDVLFNNSVTAMLQNWTGKSVFSFIISARERLYVWTIDHKIHGRNQLFKCNGDAWQDLLPACSGLDLDAPRSSWTHPGTPFLKTNK